MPSFILDIKQLGIFFVNMCWPIFTIISTFDLALIRYQLLISFCIISEHNGYEHNGDGYDDNFECTVLYRVAMYKILKLCYVSNLYYAQYCMDVLPCWSE